MAKKEGQKVRIIAIYRMLLTTSKPITATGILRKLDALYGITADRKTIYDDIAAVNRVVPIKTIMGRSGGFCLWDVLGECGDGK